MMKGAVVTGANGFIGRALTAELKQQGIRVLAVAREHSQLPQDAQIVPVTLDLARLAQLPALTEERWDVFYHLAWSGTSGQGRKDLTAQLFNVEATAQAVQTAKLLGCKCFIGAGSIMEREVLAASAVPQVRLGSGHIYGTAKLAAHQISRCVAAELEIDHIWAVITNAYGAGEDSPRLLNTTLRNIIQNKALDFTSSTQNYDFVHVEDVARALLLLGQRGSPFAEYTLGSGCARPLKEFIEELCQAVAPGRTPDFGRIPFEGVSLPLEAFDTALLCRDTGFAPQIGFREGVCRTMRWLEQSYEPVKKGALP